MGYEKEYASLNQFNSMRDYINPQNGGIKDILKKSKKLFSLLEGKLEIHEKIEGKEIIPAVSFDGGMATLFPNELSEIKLIKVAGGTAPIHDKKFKFRDYFFHIRTGLLSWPAAFDMKAKDISDDIAKEFVSLDWVKEALAEIKVDEKEFFDHLVFLLDKRKYKTVEDVYREFMEWFLLILFKKDNKGKFLIIKDGSLYPSGFVVGQKYVEILYSWINENKVKAVGLVKSSRFLSEEKSWGTPIKKRAKTMKGHSFFKIPTALEKMIDKDFEKNRFERIFISLYKGQAVFECQFSHLIEKEEAMKIMVSQATLTHGGSVITNSYAHRKASLSERESQYLTNMIRNNS